MQAYQVINYCNWNILFFCFTFYCRTWMKTLSLKFKMKQLPYQLSRIFTTCVSKTTGPGKMQTTPIEILWYLMAMLQIHSGQISLKAIWTSSIHQLRPTATDTESSNLRKRVMFSVPICMYPKWIQLLGQSSMNVRTTALHWGEFGNSARI